MKGITRSVSYVAALAGWLALGVMLNTLVPAAKGADKHASAKANYLEPRILTGTIYADESSHEALFHFRRTVVESNSTIRVLREYTRPNGSTAAREHVVYVDGKLASYQLEELQTGARAAATVDPGKQRIAFDYSMGSTKRNDSEKLQPDTLIGDMVAPFILAHWERLMSGSSVKFRMVAPSRAETVGFKLVKDSDTTMRGKPVVVIRMEPSSLIIASLIDPLRFTIERDPPHRILQYSGRITPAVQRNGKWADIDALTVFDWK